MKKEWTSPEVQVLSVEKTMDATTNGHKGGGGKGRDDS